MLNFRRSIILAIVLTACGCAGSLPPPKNANNICRIFHERPIWYDAAQNAKRKWGLPIPVLMAIMHKESGFTAEAKPPRTTCLFIFPGPRPSSAYGYPQAIDSIWEEYIESTGNWGADRDDFKDACDFIGWYCSVSHTRCGISLKDSYHLYLAYHEGQGGYLRKTYQKKAWVRKLAWRVKKRAAMYSRQLASCENEFRRSGPCCLWPF